MITAPIEARKKGLRGNDIAILIVEAIEKAEETCLQILEEKATQAQTYPLPLNSSPKVNDDLDFMVCANLRP